MWLVWVRKGGVHRVLVGIPEGKRPLGRPRRRRVDIQEVGCGYMDWIGRTQNRDRWRTLVSAVMHLRVPWNAGNFLTSCIPVSFSRRTLHHEVSKCIYIHTPKILTKTALLTSEQTQVYCKLYIAVCFNEVGYNVETCRSFFSTCTTDGHLQRVLYQILY